MRYLFFILLLLVFTQCEKFVMDRDFPLYLQNNSIRSVRAYSNDDINYSALYPDTSISDFKMRLSVEVHSGERKTIAGGSAPWKSTFEVSVPYDTFSIFVFEVDTLQAYSWNEIIEDYKVLQRYDLSLEDLERLDYKLSYPPDAKMSGVKMYPPYP